MTADFDPDDCSAETFWHPSLEMWALRVRHLPTGTEIVRYAGHDRAARAVRRSDAAWRAR